MKKISVVRRMGIGQIIGLFLFLQVFQETSFFASLVGLLKQHYLFGLLLLLQESKISLLNSAYFLNIVQM